MKKFLVSNWKMNPSNLKSAEVLLSKYKNIKSKNTQFVFCLPSVFLNAKLVPKGFFLGAQNVSSEKEGAFTGEISASQLKSVKVSHCIVGHSERRKMGETSTDISKKINMLLKNNITPVVCVGEEDRDVSGFHWANLSEQIRDTFASVPRALVSKCIIAYEPVWAIGQGSGGVMKPALISESVIFIKKIISQMFGIKIAEKIPVLYGGSVDEKNVEETLEATELSGLLLGRASLDPKQFIKIAQVLK